MFNEKEHIPVLIIHGWRLAVNVLADCDDSDLCSWFLFLVPLGYFRSIYSCAKQLGNLIFYLPLVKIENILLNQCQYINIHILE
ncbi:MAG: hypothetical protein FKGGLIKP_00368 [Sodalis sp. Fse]|nr:MAG: hypothetical protein FKGGLIKP_00368 [Sodalis sp. Fse]